ncbi:JAB domain-containing protein [Bacillus sp. ISL-75]|uniref:JAB domain-containing protein n=1 Tax=Bacillus sp. ISL-75 TaxID=2819137 RepID=UPI002036514E|nr:JAB domain-containing protein [Bacillus sp. ISL-75]
MRNGASVLEVTKRLVEAGKIMGIEVLDHIIVSSLSPFLFHNQEMFIKCNKNIDQY